MNNLTKKQPSTPNAVAKVYDGSRVVPHRVQAGESLSRIAAIYLFKTWQPIWHYNAVIFHSIGKDPNFIREGITILIPRTAKGYADMIKRLEQVKRIAQAQADALLYELEGQQYALKAEKILFDFASDVSTSIVSLSLKAATTAKAAAALHGAKLQAKIAAHLSLNAVTREFAEKFAQIRSSRVAGALKSYADKVAGTKDFWKDAALKTGGALAGGADSALQKPTVDDDSEWFSKTWKLIVTGFGIADAAKAFKATKSLIGLGLDGLGILLEYAKPSAIAEWVLLQKTGETAAQSQEHARSTILAVAKKTTDLIDAAITKYTAESNALYGNSRAAAA